MVDLSLDTHENEKSIDFLAIARTCPGVVLFYRARASLPGCFLGQDTRPEVLVFGEVVPILGGEGRVARR